MSATRKSAAQTISAWLVTWDWAGDHAARSPKVAAVLSPRLSGRTVARWVEQLYLDSEFEPSERIAYIAAPQRNPYRAQFGTLHGAPWEGQIHLWAQPLLVCTQGEKPTRRRRDW